MNTIGKDRWPEFVKRAVGDKKGIEIKEENGRYYAYSYKNVWNKEKRRSERATTRYLGVVTEKGIQTSHEMALGGIYEYGHVVFVWKVLENNGVIDLLKKAFDEWQTILAFAMNRLINPTAIKSMSSWYTKTYLPKILHAKMSPKSISKILGDVGRNWAAQSMFFKELKRSREKIIYDGSVIFSSSEDNPLLEIGYNKDNLLLPKANIVLAFSSDRHVPIFMRVVPGSVHEITTVDILLEELGKNIILVVDKGFYSSKKTEKIVDKGVKLIIPLKRDSKMVDYSMKREQFFIYRKRPIKYCYYKKDEWYVYLYEDISLKYEEEKEYYLLLSKGKKVSYNSEWAGTIAILSPIKMKPKKIYEMWKCRDEIEKAFNVLQNFLDTDTPYVRREDTFRGYIFSSFIALFTYYLILRKLKEASINDKVSVSDILLELSKVYMVEIKGKDIISEVSRRNMNLLKTLNMIDIVGKNGMS